MRCQFDVALANEWPSVHLAGAKADAFVLSAFVFFFLKRGESPGRRLPVVRLALLT